MLLLLSSLALLGVLLDGTHRLAGNACVRVNKGTRARGRGANLGGHLERLLLLGLGHVCV